MEARTTTAVETVVLGAGFSGLCAAFELLRHGRTDFVVLEQASEVGGTWRDNVYPGVECDVPSHLYSYSFALNPNWSKSYPTGNEIWEYQRSFAERFGLRPYIRFNVQATSATWTGSEWIVETEGGGRYSARYLIGALGGLSLPNLPVFDGQNDFAGQMFHTSRWPKGLDLSGKRVGVIGTGASAVQLAPVVARAADHLHVFQRSPIWVAPKDDKPFSPEEREAFASDPRAMRRHRWEIWRQIESQGVDLIRPDSLANRAIGDLTRKTLLETVHDETVAARLLPSYNIACKRPTFSMDYYPMYNRPNVTLVTEPIEHMYRGGIVAGGNEIELDVIALATGFQPFAITSSIAIEGVGGRSLADAWSERITTYRSVMVDGFPNLFLVLGPNSAGLISAMQMMEPGVQFAVSTIARLEAAGVKGLHPARRAVEDFTQWMDELTDLSAMGKGCSSWWTRTGFNHSMFPETSITYRQMLQRTSPDHFEVLRVNPPASFDGDLILVVGVGSDVGRECAGYLAARGAELILTDPRPGAAQAVADEADLRDSVRGVADGGTDRDALEVALADMRLDGVVHCVRRIPPDEQASPADDADPLAALHREISDAHAVAVLAARHMAASGGSVVIVLPGHGLFGVPGIWLQTMCLGAVVGLSRSLAMELEQSRVRVNAVAPILSDDLPDAFLRQNRHIDVERYTPESALAAVGTLLHRRCAINGAVVSAAGGRLARVGLVTGMGLFADGLEPEEVLADTDTLTSLAGHIELRSTLEEILLIDV